MKTILAVRAEGVMYYGTELRFDAGMHVLHGVRMYAKAYNAKRDASKGYAEPREDVMFGGTFQATKVEPPEWWNVTKEDAEAALAKKG